jgi:O-antigen/teichoic acid export membrane protein
MNELTAGVSWIAVVVSFVASFMLGWLWYSPMLFGKKWAEGVGVEMGDASTMPIFAMVTQALGTFCLAWLFGITAANEALLTIILVLITLILLIVSNGKYAQKSNAAVGIEGAYIFTMGVVMIICQRIF